MKSWEIRPSADASIEYIPLLSGRAFFTVDNSGSTAGAILEQERGFVDATRRQQGHSQATIAFWNTFSGNSTSEFTSSCWQKTEGASHPADILKNSQALAVIREADVWLLLIDGDAFYNDAHHLAGLAHEANVLNVPVIFVIVGSRGRSPSSFNTSVGVSLIPCFHHALMLFKEVETGRLYVIAAKGCFAPLVKPAATKSLSTWNSTIRFKDEIDFWHYCLDKGIAVPTAKTRSYLPRGIRVSPGPKQAEDADVWVDVDELVKADNLSDQDLGMLLDDQSLRNLATAYRLRHRSHELSRFVRSQKVVKVTPRLDDVAGAAGIIKRMAECSFTGERRVLQEDLRQAHSKNREYYQNTVASFADSTKAQALKKRNRLVNAALRTITSSESRSSNVGTVGLGSNRARGADVVDSDTTIAMANLDLQGPAYKAYCLICCGEAEVMSICLKELDANAVEANLKDFALDFPLAVGTYSKNLEIISCQNVCFQGALLGPSGMSISHENLKAIIPAVEYKGSNRKYIDDQLYIALTGGRVIGHTTIAKLFMAILDEVLQTKDWAGANVVSEQTSTDSQDEIGQRRTTFGWVLGQLIENTQTRQSFSEAVGPLVTCPQALVWLAEDFTRNNISSDLVGHPIRSFNKLISLARRTGIFTKQTISTMKLTKLIHSIAEKYLAELQSTTHWTSETTGEDWKQKYLALLYCDFHTPLIPKDCNGPNSVVGIEVFSKRLATLLDYAPYRLLLETTDTRAMRKVQLVTFWLLYGQKAHCTTTTFFSRIQHNQPLASAALDPSLEVPGQELLSVLLSSFVSRDTVRHIDPRIAQSHVGWIPFRTPFGPSVLRCGYESCNEPFYDKKCTSNPVDVEAIRQARARHLVKAYGVHGSFANSNGLPQRIVNGKSPTSTHSNVHISVVRTWLEASQGQKRKIVDDDGAREDFVRNVRRRICAGGRGNYFNADLEQDIGDILPSFFDTMRQALRLAGEESEDITTYEHNLEGNTLRAKIEYELKLEEFERCR